MAETTGRKIKLSRRSLSFHDPNIMCSTCFPIPPVQVYMLVIRLDISLLISMPAIKRLKGFNVLHPMGYDAFGLPAEQYAIQTGQPPAITTEQNINRYREQLDNIGLSFDWSREVRTSDPAYYKWTQWIFLKLVWLHGIITNQKKQRQSRSSLTEFNYRWKYRSECCSCIRNHYFLC